MTWRWQMFSSSSSDTRRPNRSPSPALTLIQISSSRILFYAVRFCIRRSTIRPSRRIAGGLTSLKDSPDRSELLRKLFTALLSGNQGLSEPTENELREMLAADPDNVEVLLKLASSLGLVQDENAQEVEALIKRALKLRPTSVSAHMFLGLLLASQQRREEAEDVFESLLVLQPKHVAGLFNLAQLKGQQRKIAEGSRLLRRCLELEPRLLPEWRETIRRKETAKQEDQYPGYVEMTLQLARDYAREKAWDRMAGLLPRDGPSSLTSAVHNDAEILRLRATAFMRLGRWQDAVADLSRLRKSSGDAMAIYRDRATAYANLAQWDAAVADFEAALKLNPAGPGLQPFLLCSLQGRGDVESFRKLAAKILRQFGSDDESRRMQFAAFVALCFPESEMVIDDLDAFLEHADEVAADYRGKIPFHVYFRVAALYRHRQYERALDAFRIAKAKVKPGPWENLFLAMILARLGQVEQVEKIFSPVAKTYKAHENPSWLHRYIGQKMVSEARAVIYAAREKD